MSILASTADSVATSSRASNQPPWQASLRRAVRDPVALCRLLDLPEEYASQAAAAAGQFPVFVPHEYLARIRPADPNDPLLRQVLPLAEELDEAPRFNVDPVGDGAAALAPGLLQKYHSRVLLVTTGACAVHCRYCFRRHFPYTEVPSGTEAWGPALQHIAADPSVNEVLLSGGDPLTLVDTRLAALAGQLDSVEHLRRLRIHTRLPIMIPSRVTEELIAWLVGGRLTPIVVIHANHARELDETVAGAIADLVQSGVTVLNQAVLLRGVNDSIDALVDLSERLLDLRVMPYYLHQLDRVAGAAHFEVPIERGRQLVAAMRENLPGYAVPRYVQEIAGEASKVVLL